MSKAKRRFVFLDYNDLKKVKFRKLEKVADRIFVLIDQKNKKVPLKLIQATQRLGKKVKWILAEPDAHVRLDFHLSFLLGMLHRKVHSEVEFAILSNNPSFDALVDFVNDSGRDCLRVERKSKKRKPSKRMKKSAAMLSLNPISQQLPEPSGEVDKSATFRAN